MTEWKKIGLWALGVFVALAVIGAFLPDDKKSSGAEGTSTVPATAPASASMLPSAMPANTSASAKTPTPAHTTTAAKPSATARTSQGPATPGGLTMAQLKVQMINDYGPDLGARTFSVVKRVHTVANAPWVETSLYPDSDAAGPARLLCSAIQQYYVEHPSARVKDQPSGLSVRASTGNRLVLLRSLDDPCMVEA